MWYEWVTFGTKPNTDVFIQLKILVSDDCGDQIVNGSFRWKLLLFSTTVHFTCMQWTGQGREGEEDVSRSINALPVYGK